MQTRASEVGEELNTLFNSIPHNYCPAGALTQTQDQKLGHKFKYSAFPKFSQEDYYFGLGIRMDRWSKTNAKLQLFMAHRPSISRYATSDRAGFSALATVVV